jgi:hypothetical protein
MDFDAFRTALRRGPDDELGGLDLELIMRQGRRVRRRRRMLVTGAATAMSAAVLLAVLVLAYPTALPPSPAVPPEPTTSERTQAPSPPNPIPPNPIPSPRPTNLNEPSGAQLPPAVPEVQPSPPDGCPHNAASPLPTRPPAPAESIVPASPLATNCP